jgi:Rrf2 family transcriptional regulator, iron-sulfur cluster assembly transcription factor
MLSTTCKYAIRAVVYISINQKENQKVGIRQIAADTKIPSPFLSKILQVLAKRGILSSVKGPNGGFALGRKAKDITFYDIVEIIDTDSIFNTCILGLNLCSNDIEIQKICPVHPHSDPIRKGLYDFFKQHTIDDISCKLKDFEKLLDL